MATLSSLLVLKPNPLTPLTHFTFSSNQPTHLLNSRNFQNLSCLINKSTNFSRIYVPKCSYFIVDCSIIKQRKQQHDVLLNLIDESSSSSSSGFDVAVVSDVIIGLLKSITKPAMVAVLLGALFMFDPYYAIAASGGRMGGRSFSSRSSRSSSSSSYSFGSSSSSSLSSSKSYSTGSSGWGGSSVPYHKEQSRIQEKEIPAPTNFFNKVDKKFHAPANIFMLSRDGNPSSVTALSSSVTASHEPTSSVGNAVSIGRKDQGASYGWFWLLLLVFILMACTFISQYDGDDLFTAPEKTSVLKLQVGLLGSARSLQEDLNRIAEVANTSTPKGLSYVLTETTLALLRNPDFCISGYSSTDVKRSIDEGEQRFNRFSVEERAKLDEETLLNVDNIRRKSSSSQSASGSSNDYIVITILVAAEGVHKLPAIESSSDLKEALQKLGSIQSSKTMAVEVLWTPQDENDTLSKEKLLEDYPLLMPL